MACFFFDSLFDGIFTLLLGERGFLAVLVWLLGSSSSCQQARVAWSGPGLSPTVGSAIPAVCVCVGVCVCVCFNNNSHNNNTHNNKKNNNKNKNKNKNKK